MGEIRESRFTKIGEGKLSSQGTGTFPLKGRVLAKWLEGDKLEYWVDVERGEILVKNETLNETLTFAERYVSNLLSKYIADENSPSVIFIQGDFRESNPIETLRKYMVLNKGFLDLEDSRKGKFYLSEESMYYFQRANGDEVDSEFLTAFKRYVKEDDIPGAYIYNAYGAANYDLGTQTVIDIKKTLKSLNGSQKVIFFSYLVDPQEVMKRYGIEKCTYVNLRDQEDLVKEISASKAE